MDNLIILIVIIGLFWTVFSFLHGLNKRLLILEEAKTRYYQTLHSVSSEIKERLQKQENQFETLRHQTESDLKFMERAKQNIIEYNKELNKRLENEAANSKNKQKYINKNNGAKKV